MLITESTEEFNRFHDALKDELKTSGTVEHLILNDIAELAWEIRRYRRAKTSLINSAVLPALRNLLRPAVPRSIPEGQNRKKSSDDFGLHTYTRADFEADSKVAAEVERLAHQWFVDENDRKMILEMLGDCKLDEYAIETEAMRIVAPELEKFDRFLLSLEWRRDKALRSLAEFRGGWGRDLHATVERMIDGEVLALDNASKKPPPAAA